MSEYKSTVTQKGQVTIPAQVRRTLNIKPKDMVMFTLGDGEAHLRPIQSRVLASYGAVKPLRKPEDFRQIRREVEQEIAEQAFEEA